MKIRVSNLKYQSSAIRLVAASDTSNTGYLTNSVSASYLMYLCGVKKQKTG